MGPPALKRFDGIKDTAIDGRSFAEVFRSGSATADDVLTVHLGDFYLRIFIETFHMVVNKDVSRVDLANLEKNC